jgi:hypothetical protein
MSIERLYRYRARVHRYPASIYDGDALRLDIDYGFSFAQSPTARVGSGT